MTTIFKMADHENITSTFEQVESSILNTWHDGVEPKVAKSLDDVGLSDEMDKIEKCASSGSNYAYNPDWTPEQLSQIREYAAVVGFKGKMCPVTHEVHSTNSNKQQTLGENIVVNQPKVSADLSMAVGDPFHLTDLKDEAKQTDNWEKISFEKKLASVPDITSNPGSIVPIRGEFEYEKQQTLKVRRGENSLASPDAIGSFANEIDTGERLRQENANALNERKAAKTAWQKEAVQTAKNIGPGALPRGKVFMTGSIPEKPMQSGLDLKQASEELSGMKTVPDLPDLTDGEKLREANANRKDNIQRKSQSDDWQKVKGSTRPSLDDAFANALESQLLKAGIK